MILKYNVHSIVFGRGALGHTPMAHFNLYKPSQVKILRMPLTTKHQNTYSLFNNYYNHILIKHNIYTRCIIILVLTAG